MPQPAVYGNNEQALSNEQSSILPTEICTETKLQSEKIIHASGCNYHILRLATFYGKGIRQSLAIHRFIANHLACKPLKIHGDGTQTCAYTHVQDIVEAICMVIKWHDVPSCLNVAHPESHLVNDMIAMIETITNKQSMPQYVADRHRQIYHSLIDSTAMRGLGWHPKWTLAQGLENYIMLLQHHGDMA